MLEDDEPDPGRPRTPLNRTRVLRAAVDVADARGVGALTMRGVASELGFEVMSLYNHVASKDDLLDGMVDLVAADIEPPSGEAGWRTAMRRSAVSAHEALQRHPWAARMWTGRPPGPARLEHMESWLRTLATSGLDPDAAHTGFHALTNHVIGFALQEADLALVAGPELGARAEAFLATLPDGAYPHLVAHVRQHIAADGTGDSFGFVLDLILDGLEASVPA